MIIVILSKVAKHPCVVKLNDITKKNDFLGL